MKSYALLTFFITALASFSGFSQETNPEILAKKLKNAQLAVTDQDVEGMVFQSYLVEEKINSKFGSQVTTYEVISLDFIATNDLGPNNTRTVTIKYRTAKPKRTATGIAGSQDVTASREP